MASAALGKLFGGGMSVTVNTSNIITGSREYFETGSTEVHIWGINENTSATEKLVGIAELLLKRLYRSGIRGQFK